MLEFDNLEAMRGHLGKPLGAGAWLTIDQERINQFAEATGDHQWIHVDVERAKREMPNGKTIAHGYLTLSLIPLLAQSVVKVKGRSRSINYGSNKVRFLAPIQCGCRIRLVMTLKSMESVAGGTRVSYDCTIEIEGQDKPAMIAETVHISYD
jgi:acyl dehydratase